MPNVFDFRPGRSIRGVNPQAVGHELERLRAEHGSLTPTVVLEASADPASPLHAAFEWDDSEAAKQHRLAQARRLIVSVRVLNSPVGKPTVAFVSVKTPSHGREYVPTVEAMGDEELRERVLAEVRGFIESLERRYSHLVDVSGLVGGLRKAAG